MTAYAYGTEPRPYQHTVFEQTRDEPAFAWFLQQRLGKSKIGVDNACYLWGQNRVDALLVVAPSGVHRGWTCGDAEQGEHSGGHFGQHVPAHVRSRTAYWNSKARKHERDALDALMEPADQPTLRVLSVNVEAIGQSRRAHDFVTRFVHAFRTMLIVDESTTIKNKNARTERVLKLAEQCPYVRLLSGEPAPEGPMDLYYQLKALDPMPLGFSSFYAFRNRYAVLRTRQVPHPNPKKAGTMMKFKEIVNYKNEDELRHKLDRVSVSLRREDCHADLPDASYDNRYVTPTDEQRRLYNEIIDDGLYRLNDSGDELDGVELQHVLTRLIRAQQVLGGFLPDEGGQTQAVPGGNPKLDALLAEVEQLGGKSVVWSVYRAEQEAIAAALRDRLGGDAVVEYHGGIDADQRDRAKAAFQHGDDVRVFVGSPKAGRYSLELSAANDVLWYSWSHPLEPYVQANDRVVHVSKTDPIYYLHLVVPDSGEAKMLAALRAKQSLAGRLRTFADARDLLRESRL